jgi:hypothetical protein
MATNMDSRMPVTTSIPANSTGSDGSHGTRRQ